MTERYRYERITDDAGDRLTVFVNDVPATTIDLVNGASPEARAILERLGLDLTAILAAAWGED